MKTAEEIQALRDKRFSMWTAAKNFLYDHTDANGQISDTDAREFERREKQMKELSNTIELYSRCNATENEFNKLSTPYTIGKVKTHPLNNQFLGNVAGGNRMYQTSGEYRQHFLSAVRQNFRNDAADYLREGMDSKGGYLVPTEMNDEIVTKLTQENVMRQICKTITTESRHKIPVLASRPAAAWINEGSEITLSDETFTQIELDAYKLAAGTKISNELLQDSFYNLENFFVEEFGKSLATAEEAAFISGTGNNEPQGFLTALDSDAEVTTASPKATVEDLIEIVYKLPRPYRQNACWLMHDNALQRIRRLKDDNYRYYWTPTLTEGEPEKLLGFPVYTSAFMPQYSDDASGQIVAAFGDFSRYYVADRGTRIFRPLRELYALNDLSAFLMIERVDGRLVDKAAIKLLKLK